MSEITSPPRENLIRAMPGAIEFRAADVTDGEDLPEGVLGVMRVLFSPVGEWTEINSMWEGHFLERFDAGAWRKTIRDSSAKIRSLFQHGMDPQVGDKPLGPIRKLEENEQGGYGEVDLIDTSYNRDLLPGLKADLYGASHRFQAVREVWDDDPEPSDANPKGLPERTIKEARLMEFGPVTFPAYQGATAGVRSLTDEFLISCFRSNPDRLREMFDRAADISTTEQDPAPSEGDAEPEPGSHLADERRGLTATPSTGARTPIYGLRRKEKPPWLLAPSKSTKRS